MSCEVHDKCDSRCSMATGPKCNCACEGLNHGAAYLGTIEQERLLALWLAQEVE
jgi:hypothetical protein